MSHNVLVYDPIAPCVTQPQQTRRALDALAGKVIGFIDNSKPNFNHLVEDVSQVLIEKHGVESRHEAPQAQRVAGRVRERDERTRRAVPTPSSPAPATEARARRGVSTTV